LVCARLPPVELRRRPESIVRPPLGPAEAHGVRVALLHLLIVVAAAAARWASAADVTPLQPIDEFPDMLLARAVSICAWRGGLLRPAARNCGGGEGKCGEVEPGFGPNRTHQPLYHGRWGQMGAPATAMRADGPIRGLICMKKAPNLQIGSDDAMQADIGGLLELL
jgi:hypothetical protein